MGSIASYKYPEHDIDTAVEIVEAVHNKGISKQEILAEELDHNSPDSGAFRNKLTSLRRYGLITGRGDITLSSLADKIVAPRPNSNERQQAIGQAVINVEILRKLYEKLDCQQPSDDFWYHIVEVSDSERGEAKEKSGELRRLYEVGRPYVEGYFADRRTPDESPQEVAGESQDTGDNRDIDPVDTSSGDTQIPEEALGVLVTPDAQIEIKNNATYTAAKALFEDIEDKLE